MTVPKGSPREGGAASEASRGGGGRYEEAGPTLNVGPAIVVSYSLIFGGVEFIIRLSIYSDLVFTHLSKSIARSESLMVTGLLRPV